MVYVKISVEDDEGAGIRGGRDNCQCFLRPTHRNVEFTSCFAIIGEVLAIAGHNHDVLALKSLRFMNRAYGSQRNGRVRVGSPTSQFC